MKNYETLEALILDWAKERNLITQDSKNLRQQQLAQLAKSMSEFGELADAVAKEDLEGTIDALGDVLVTLIILSRLLNMDLISCLRTAYSEIKDRTGKTVNGVFIKDNKYGEGYDNDEDEAEVQTSDGC